MDNSPNIRKKEAFSAFIKILQDGTVAHWVNVAVALGVNKDTITAWKGLPEAQEAIKKGIEKALNGMEKAGGKDWRMWESKLKMLGAIPTEKQMLDITSDDKPLPMPIMGGLSNNHV